jgi:HEAT repeat protein
MNSASQNDRLVAALQSPATSDRVNALLSIIANPDQELSGEAVKAIANCLSADSKTIRRRAADALAAAARHDRKLIPTLRASLESLEGRIRFGAAYALGAIDETALTVDAAAVLCEALGDSDGDVRWAAAELIVRLGLRHLTEVCALLITLARDGNALARKMALYCMRDLGAAGDITFDAAGTAIRDDDVHVRLAALALLSGCHGHRDEAASLIVDCLDSDREIGVRRAAAVALGVIQSRSPQALEALRRIESRSTDESLARAARTALNRLAGS